jgi:hypothetical protein
MGATHELWDGRDRHLITASRPGDVSENRFVRVIPVDAPTSATVGADRVGWAYRLRR